MEYDVTVDILIRPVRMQSRKNQDFFDAFTKLNKKTKSSSERFGVLLCDLETCDFTQKQLLHRILFDDSSSAHYWLDYVQYVEQLSDKKNSLHKLIIKALDCINEIENKDNVQYVKLHLKYAELSTDSAASKYYQILSKKEIGKRVAQLFLSWSELEMKLLNFDKAIDILNKGIQYQAEPVQKLFTKLQLLRENSIKKEKISNNEPVTITKLDLLYDDGEVQIQNSKRSHKDSRSDVTQRPLQDNKEDLDVTVASIPSIEFSNHNQKKDIQFLNDNNNSTSSNIMISKDTSSELNRSVTLTSTKNITSSRLATKRSLMATGLGKCQRVKLEGNHSITTGSTGTHTNSTQMDTTIVLDEKADNNNSNSNDDDSEIIFNYQHRKPIVRSKVTVSSASTTVPNTSANPNPSTITTAPVAGTSTSQSPSTKAKGNRKSHLTTTSITRNTRDALDPTPSNSNSNQLLVVPEETNTVNHISVTVQPTSSPLPITLPVDYADVVIPTETANKVTKKRSTSTLRSTRHESHLPLEGMESQPAKHTKTSKKISPTVISDDIFNGVKSESMKANEDDHKESTIVPSSSSSTTTTTTTTTVKSATTNNNNFQNIMTSTSHHTTPTSPLTSSSSINLDPRHVSQDITEKQLPDIISKNNSILPTASQKSRRVSFKENEINNNQHTGSLNITVVDEQLTTNIPPRASSMNTTGNVSNDDDSNVIVLNKKKPAKPTYSTNNSKIMVSTSTSNTTTTKPKSTTTAADNVMKNRDTIFINGRSYIKLGLLGKGASSSVYRVYSEDDGQLYAYKRVDIRIGMCNGSSHTPSNDHGADGDDVEVQQSEDMMDSVFKSYINEIELLKKLAGCPYIVEMKEAEVNRSELYVAMIMEAGEVDLAKALHRQKKLQTQNNLPSNPFFSRIIWYEMLLAVDYMHSQRIVHGDLKPANFVFSQGKLKLIDFGIAKAISNDTTNIYRDTTIGTVNYMAPEAICPIQDNGDMKMRLGRASDIWSMGCILYQIIYGNPPFAAFNLMQRMHAITNPNYKIEYPEYHDISAIETIQSCLQRNPQTRASIKELLSGKFLSVTTTDTTVTTTSNITTNNISTHQKITGNTVISSNNHSNISRDEACTTSSSINTLPIPVAVAAGVANPVQEVLTQEISAPSDQNLLHSKMPLNYDQVCQVVKLALLKSKTNNSNSSINLNDENAISKEIYKELMLSNPPTTNASKSDSLNEKIQQIEFTTEGNTTNNNNNNNNNNIKINNENNKAQMFAEIRKNTLRSSSSTSTSILSNENNGKEEGGLGGGGTGTKARKPLQALKSMPTGLRSEILDGKLRLSSLNNFKNIQTNTNNTTNNINNASKSTGNDRVSRWIRPHGNTPEKLDMKSVIEKRMNELRKFLQHDDTEENNLLDISFQNF